METTTNTKTKKSAENERRKCRSHLNHKSFSENFIHDTLKMFTKPMGDISIRIM